MPRRVVSVDDNLRFAAGWRLALDHVPVELHPILPGGPPQDPAAADDAITVDIVRARDLVALGVAFTGCELVTGDGLPPAVRPRAGVDDARLFVDHSFQHGFERAVYETPATIQDPITGAAQLPADQDLSNPVNVDDPPGTTVTAPVEWRPARTSRLVFAIPADLEIEFSSVGILAAMRMLELVVHPLAAPGDAPTIGRTGAGGRGLVGIDPGIIHIGDGLVLEMHSTGPVIRTATRAILRANPAPDVATAAGRRVHSRNLRRAREVLATATPTIAPRTRIPDNSIFRPGGGLVPNLPDIRVSRQKLSRPPTPSETGIEAPYRLVISPSAEARFAHAPAPVGSVDDVHHVELWHSRLAHVPTEAGGLPDEKNATRRIVRALWARDRDWVGDDWKASDQDNDNSFSLSHTVDDSATRGPGVRGSLDRFDRHMLVRQSAETWLGEDDAPIAPVPVAADALWLSSVGAWLDLHGAWTTKPYSEVQMQSILSWDHVAPMGRDQFVRVVYPGYLYPFGHQTALVKLTERKMKTSTNSVAGLYQRMFLVIGQRRRTSTARNLPFEQVDIRPLVSPVIDPLTETEGDSQVNWFWPRVGGPRFAFTIDTLDAQRRPVRLHTPLMWVSEAFNNAAARTKVNNAYAGDPDRKVALDGQKVAYVDRMDDGPDTQLETTAMWLLGEAALGTSTPRLSAATVVVPAVQQVSRTGPISISYRDEYVANDFGAGDVGQVWARVNEGGGNELPQVDPTTILPQMKFGAGADAGSDKAGGFVAPDLPIRALARDRGPVGDAASAVTNDFDPAAFLAGALPKLFGLVKLTDLIPVDGSAFPSVVSDTLGRIESFSRDLERVVAEAQAAIGEADALVARATSKSADLQARAQQAVTAAAQVAADAQAVAQAFDDLLTALAGMELADIGDEVGDFFDEVDDLVTGMRALADLLPPQAATVLRQLADALAAVAAAGDLVEDIFDFVSGFDPKNLEQGFSFEWTPALQQWPATDPMFVLQPPGGASDHDHLVLAVRGKVSADGTADVTASAELRDFALVLFGVEPLIKVPFDHMFFKAGSSGKPEVDVVLGEIEFLGILSFVETIKDLIPFDGFSDPPYMEVSPSGAVAGFTLELPNVAVGVFNLSNMALGADVHVPFLGETVTVGFNFCSRERPFCLTVMCLGGGGWFLIRVAPDGLDLLEVGLEATASLSVDFGVASGSISAAVGLYMRLEGETGSLTGYFRLRGEVDVLGLISASIELYMELVYHFDTGKMIGRATITVTVEVLVFSGTVKISAERQLAGSNGDPSFREILGAEDGTSPAWTDYCMAFAAEE